MSDVVESPAVPRKRGGGPKTPEGKERAKANSMKHGLRAKVLLPEDLVAVFEEYKIELFRQFEPVTKYEGWLVGEMALAMARLDRCADLSVADLRRCLDIAAFDWDDDRKTQVENLGKKLAADPSRVAHALEQSRHGADWIIERWEGFRSALTAVGSCDDDLRRLALDLMGVPLEVRQGDYKVPPAADVAGLTDLAARQIARLRDRQEFVLEDRDESRRSMAMAGMAYDEDAGTARLRRYESGIRRALERAQAELRRVREEAANGGEAQPAARPSSVEPLMSGAAVKYQVERVIASQCGTWTDVAPPDDEIEDEDEVLAPSAATDPDPETAPGVERPVAVMPVVARAAGVFPASASARTAAHRSAGPRNRFEQRVAKSQARKAARLAAKGR